MTHTLVAFHAHPDDEALLTSGTMARAAAKGHRVVVVVATDGDLGLTSREYAADGRLGARRLEAIPLALDYCSTRLADRDEAAWITRRFRHACAAFDTDVKVEDQRLVVTWR